MFDPYHRWLAIPPDQRPPTFYQLLGIATTETDPEVIQEAALRQASHVRNYQRGPNAQACTTMLNEIGQACATLINPSKRREHDDRSKPQSPSLPPPLPELLPAPFSTDPPPLPVPPLPGEGTASAFGFAAGEAEVTQRHSPHGRQRRTRAIFWKEPAAYLYLCLLCGGVGLGFWLARSAHAPASANPDKPAIARQPQEPRLGEPGKKTPQRKSDAAKTPKE